MHWYQSKYCYFLIIIFSVIVYFYFGYFVARENFIVLMILFSVLFTFYAYFIKSNITSDQLFKIGLVFRVVFLFAIPFLSQDFYRFIWDGRLILAGINPYEFLPNQLLNRLVEIFQGDFLLEQMGALSANHYSNYPPINQLLFFLAAVFSSKSILGSVMIFRIFIITADIGIYYYGRKLLVYFNQDEKKIFHYFLNPLIIIELTGNLHFEGVMLLFLTMGFYFLVRNLNMLAACCIAVSISIKLMPLLILPLFLNQLRFKKSIPFYASILLLNTLCFIPFATNSLLKNYIDTISLWFVNFEFNASFYYIIREIGFYIKGYNIIQSVGKIIPVITIAIVLLYTFLKDNTSVKNVITNSLFVLTLYFFISTTVHPWYIINLILLCVFTNYKFPLYWSYLVILSYYAYSICPFRENLLLVFIEYFVVLTVFVLEISKYSKQKSL